MDSGYIIRPAVVGDAPFIAQVVMGAIGDDICVSMAGGRERLPLVYELFTRLAASDSAQYSYLNTLVAVTDSGDYAGAIVSYNGARLHELRPAFVAAANDLLGWGIADSDFEDETTADEVYLDSLMVLPQHRGRGVATSLIRAAMESHKTLGKPFGLLVDYDNPDARSLYVRLGFEPVGSRHFAGVLMEHMRHN